MACTYDFGRDRSKYVHVLLHNSNTFIIRLFSKSFSLYQAAYHFGFGALEDSQNEVSEAYARLFSDAPTEPIASVDIFAATWRWYPRRIRELIEYIPVEELQRIRRSRLVINKVFNALVNDAMEEAKVVEVEKGKKDVMSVLGTCLSSYQLRHLELHIHHQFAQTCRRIPLLNFQKTKWCPRWLL